MTILQLKSSDGVAFDVELAIAKRSVVIRTMIESLGEDNLDVPLPLTNIKSDILEKVIEFATHHKNDPMPGEDQKEDLDKMTMTEWDKQFLTAEMNTLCEYILAANYLDMKDLLTLASAEVASRLKGQNPDAIREVCKSFWIREEEEVKKGAVKEGEVKEGEVKKLAVREDDAEEGDAKEGDAKEGDAKEGEPSVEPEESEITETEKNVQNLSVQDSDIKEAGPSVN
ncbi:hypothetical protein TKK_0002843 [Trichogramma kaykai]